MMKLFKPDIKPDFKYLVFILVVSIIVAFTIRAANADNHKATHKYIATTPHIIIIKYSGCVEGETYLVGGTVTEWAGITYGLQAGTWQWSIAQSKDEMLAVARTWFMQGAYLYQEAQVDKRWCDKQDRLLKDASI